MKIYGRLTIYGEYLMHSDSYGLIEKSNLYLATNEHSGTHFHPHYDVTKDLVAKIIAEQRINIHPGVKGNLPLGYGLASSSVFSFLYLYPLYGERVYEMIRNIDKSIHGFQPSGLDVSFCYRQKSGLYKNDKWIDVSLAKLAYSLVIFPKENKMVLSDVRRKILDKRHRLSKLADDISYSVIRNNHIPYEFLQIYSNELVNCGIYSAQVVKFIENLSSKNIVAKGIGGLYDKAVLIVWPYHISVLDKSELVKEIWKWNPLNFIEIA